LEKLKVIAPSAKVGKKTEFSDTKIVKIQYRIGDKTVVRTIIK